MLNSVEIILCFAAMDLLFVTFIHQFFYINFIEIKMKVFKSILLLSQVVESVIASGQGSLDDDLMNGSDRLCTSLRIIII